MWGGAIYNRGVLTVKNSTFHNNAAYYGGAIYNLHWTTLRHVTMVGEHTTGFRNLSYMAVYNSLIPLYSSCKPSHAYYGYFWMFGSLVNIRDCGKAASGGPFYIGALTGSPAHLPLLAGSPGAGRGRRQPVRECRSARQCSTEPGGQHMRCRRDRGGRQSADAYADRDDSAYHCGWRARQSG